MIRQQWTPPPYHLIIMNYLNRTNIIYGSSKYKKIMLDQEKKKYLPGPTSLISIIKKNLCGEKNILKSD